MKLKKTIVLGIATLLLFSIVFLPVFKIIDNIFYDLNFILIKKPVPCDSVTIVAIDAHSISKIGAWPWSRSIIASVINKLNSYSPKVIAIDILFPHKPQDINGNDSLMSAFSEVKKLLLPIRASFVKDIQEPVNGTFPQSSYLIKQYFKIVLNKDNLSNINLFSANRIDASDSIFNSSASQSGVINVTTSRLDQKIREIVHVIKYDNEYIPSFGICAAAAFLDVKPSEFILDGKKPQIILGDKKIPISYYAGSTLINFRGKAGTLKCVSAYDVMLGKLDSSSIKNKLIFIGVTDPLTGADFFTTPLGSQFPGVELWATSACDILQNLWIKQANNTIELINILIMLFIFPGLAIFLSSKQKTLILFLGILLTALSIGAEFIAFNKFYFFWNPSSHFLALIFNILYLITLKGVPSLEGSLSIQFDAASSLTKDFLPPPREDDFIKAIPDCETAIFVANKLSKNIIKETKNEENLLFHTISETNNNLILTDNSQKQQNKITQSIDAKFLSAFSELCNGRIVKFIGSGGMADVYLVWLFRPEVYRAVKVIKPGKPATILERFETEIKILANLQHPNIIQFFSVGEWHSLPYIEMEYVLGMSMEDVLKKCIRLTPLETAAIGILVCKALGFAHKKTAVIYGNTYTGIIHRDLKPSNIMISKSGKIKLTDFGIARPLQENILEEEFGCVVGTLPYLAPEQISHKNISASTDIYALGVTLYELVCGKKAFPQTEIPALISAKSKSEFNPLEDYVPKKLKEIIYKAMALEPKNRYSSAEELEKDLTEFLLSQNIFNGYQIIENIVKRCKG